MEKHTAESNFKKICIIRAIRSGMFSVSILIPFFAENGVSLKEAIILQSLFSLVNIIFEVPTGNFADRYGRKLSIILGGAFSTLGFFLYSLSHSFYGFLLAETVLALGMSFISGADSALLLDTQKYLEGKNNGIFLEGRSRSWGLFSEGVTSLLGGSILAIISLRLPIYFDAAFSSLVVFVALTLKEPEKKTPEKRESLLISMFRILKYSLHSNKELGSLIFFSAFASAATLNMVWLIQPYWKLSGVPIFLFGIVWASLQFLSAGVSNKAHNIEEVAGKKFSFLIVTVFAVMGYFLLGTNSFIWGSIFIIPFYISRGLNDPILRHYITLVSPSQNLATIISTKSLIGRLTFAIIGPIIGWISEAHSLQIALLSSGVVFGVLGAWSWWQLHKHRVLV